MAEHTPDEIWIWRTGYHEPRISNKQLHADNEHYLLATPCREAAQDLLYALQDTLRIFQADLKHAPCLTSRIHAAIAKATGNAAVELPQAQTEKAASIPPEPYFDDGDLPF